MLTTHIQRLYASSEIDSHSIKVQKTRFENNPVVHLGCVKKVDEEMIKRIRPHLLIGGSPVKTFPN